MTMEAGRELARISAVIAIRKRSGGMCRRKRWPASAASFTRLRLPYLSAVFFLRPSRKKYTATSPGTEARSQSISGQRNVIVCPQVFRQTSSGRQLASSLSQVGKSENRIHEIVVGA